MVSCDFVGFPGFPAWAYVRPMLAYVGPMLAHVEPGSPLSHPRTEAPVIYGVFCLRCSKTSFFYGVSPSAARNFILAVYTQTWPQHSSVGRLPPKASSKDTGCGPLARHTGDARREGIGDQRERESERAREREKARLRASATFRSISSLCHR